MLTVSFPCFTIVSNIISKSSITFSTESVALLTAAALASSAVHLEVLRLLGDHHRHGRLPDVRVLQVSQLKSG